MNLRLLIGLFAVAFAVVLSARAPLAAALGWLPLARQGIAYVSATGTIWDGQVAGLSWRGRTLGDATVALSPWALLLGESRFAVAFTGSASGDAVVGVGLGGRIHVANVRTRLRLADLPIVLPLSGSVDVNITRASFGPKGCRDIEAEIATDALMRNPAGLAWNGPALTGKVACSDGQVVIPLAGGTGADDVKVTMTISPDRTFRIRAEARTTDQGVTRVLTAAGFSYENGVLMLQQTGRWG